MARAIGRRVVLGSLGAAALGVLVGDRVERFLQEALLPVTLHDPTGLTGLLPVAGRFRIYSVTANLPHRSSAAYRLRVGGLVARPLTLDYRDLTQRLPQTALTRDFQCVTGWRVADVAWRGVALADVLDAAGVQPSATRVRFHSFDGTYTESLSLEQARRRDVLVAHTMEGKPITREHGGPVRMYVAPMYGYKSLKWLDRIEAVDTLGDDGGGYWETRGYDLDGWVGRSNGGHEAPTS
ncbi:MAG TPA: molybdopterin-dependent oxidoreductase [Acidimicrobiales bacterium]|nr:molybdopterin-dependent oxidoreductase [Acidimicrobiales bacterium]